MGKTLLIVDDSASMRQLVTFALKGAGMTSLPLFTARMH